MTPPPPETPAAGGDRGRPSDDGVDARPAAWRTVLARRLAAFALAVDLVVTMLAALLLHGSQRNEIVLGGLVGAVGYALSLRRSVSDRTRAWLLTGSCVLSALVGHASLGFIGGPAAALVVAAIVAGFLLGRRAVTVVLATSAATIAAIAWAVVTGRLPAPTSANTSPLNPLAWLRSSGTTLLLTALAGVIVSWVVGQIEASRTRELRETERRRAAEDARREAQHLTIEAQKRELIGRLAAGLAHDFNNHLTVIAMAHGRLSDPRADDGARRDASRAITESIRSAGSLARQLLVFGRKAPRYLTDVALADVVDAVLPSIERVLPTDVVLEVVHDGDVAVRADQTQLHQALLNFVVNARDAMPGGGRLVVRTRRIVLDAPRDLGRGTASPGAWALLEVEDSGTGIEASVKDRVFEPFFSTKPLDEGSGLGLATVAMMAEEASGHVELETAVGRGTRVALWLPASGARAREPTPTSTPIPSAPSLAGRVVLVVEDEPLLLDAAVRVLADAGCQVLSAADGTAAMTTLATHQGHIDLLCTDVVMPGTPVRDVIARFRELHPASPILTCSGYVGEDLVRRGIEEGRYRLLQKPYAADDLLDAATSLLRSTSSRRRAAS